MVLYEHRANTLQSMMHDRQVSGERYQKVHYTAPRILFWDDGSYFMIQVLFYRRV